MARILVIDDDESIRETVRRVLEAQGHSVRVVEDGEDGIDSIAESAPDLVITDIFMPGRDGIETLRETRKAFPKLKVIVMSGGDSSGLMNLLDDAEMLGANRTLPKPFTPAELMRAVDGVLRA
jgi:two-component system, chemotaxis family, chemotaxis protein CheY